MRLEDRVKHLIVRALRIDREPASIADDLPLFDGGLGMDSIDALEVCVHLEKEFGAVVPTDRAAEVMRDPASLARFIVESGWVERPSEAAAAGAASSAAGAASWASGAASRAGEGR